MNRANPCTGLLAGLSALGLLAFSTAAQAEGSRDLYPADYADRGPLASRAYLDLDPGQSYLGRVNRRGFNYVFAQAGEVILLGSSNIEAGGDVLVYNPQDFGTRGDETIPLVEDFSCANGVSSDTQFAGGGLGHIGSREQELAGPNAADGSATVTDGFAPCAYQAPETGIYGVLFTGVSGGSGPNGSLTDLRAGTRTVAAWDVTVRSGFDSLDDINGRLFTYAFIGFTGGNNRPVYSTHWYVTEDGYRYRQDLRGLDPNGYALYANTFGFLDGGAPLYKDLRGTNAQVANVAAGLTTQPAEYPIFFSDITPGSDAEPEVERVLQVLGIPLAPSSPQIRDVVFAGVVGDGVTTTGVGGTFSFSTTDTLSYQIIISRDGENFDPALPENRLLTGIAFTGTHQVAWDGLDNDRLPFPPRDEPYSYRAFGRNGEVHFPIIDAENNGDPGRNPPIPGGGPTIVRLNGEAPGDRTVFFDDRGYVTSRGEEIGVLNGTLCPTDQPGAPDPAVDLSGVDSASVYRLWENGRNRNRDCASDAGWGDAKALNLWTYFLTPEVRRELIIVPTVVDLGTRVNLTGTAEAGEEVQGTFDFVNNGETTANGVTWSMQLSPGLTGVSFGNLPPGVSAVYDPATGAVTFPGAPTTMAPEDDFIGIIFRFTAPPGGPVDVSTEITTTDDDEVPENDRDDAQLAIGSVDVATAVNGLPDLVEAGTLVTGTVSYTNGGVRDAENVQYFLTLGEPGNVPADVTFSNVPPGATIDFDPATGVATISGLPDTLTVGDVVSIGFSYTAPATGAGPVVVTSAITTTSEDAIPENNSDSGDTAFFFIEIAVAAVCVDDAPYLDYTVTPVGFTAPGGATIRFIGADTATVQTLTDQPLSGRLLWPEAGVDSGGRGDAWPGWTQMDGAWIEVPTTVRPEITVAFDVNPTASRVLAYPPGTADCFTNPPADLESVISGVAPQTIPGDPVDGIVTWRNVGGTAAPDLVYQFTVGEPGNAPLAVDFTSLPPGVTADYDPATGIVTLTGMPDTLAPGDEVSIGFSFVPTTAVGGVLPLASGVTTSIRETTLENNPDLAETRLAFADDARIDVAAAAVCFNDAPYVDYTITAVNFTPTTLATIEFIDANDQVVETLTDQPLEGGRLLWPEAGVDTDGVGNAWPGWVFDNGWIEVPTTVRPQVTVRFQVNPEFVQTFDYPPSTEACVTDPPIEPPPQEDPPEDDPPPDDPPADDPPVDDPMLREPSAVPMSGPWLLLMAALLAGIGAGALRRQPTVSRR